MIKKKQIETKSKLDCLCFFMILKLQQYFSYITTTTSQKCCHLFLNQFLTFFASNWVLFLLKQWWKALLSSRM